MVPTRAIVLSIPRQDKTMTGYLMTSDFISKSGNRSALAKDYTCSHFHGDNVMFIRLTTYLQHDNVIRQATCRTFDFDPETVQSFKGMIQVDLWNDPGPADRAGWTEVVIRGDLGDLHVTIAGFSEATGKTSISKRLLTAESGYVSTSIAWFPWQADSTFKYSCTDHADKFSCQNNYEVTL